MANNKKSTNSIDKKRKKTIALVVAALLVGLLVGGYLYVSSRADSPDVEQGKISTDDKPLNASGGTENTSGSGSSTQKMTPQEPTTPPVVQSNSMPTPVLAKSSGNSGSIPAGVLVNLTCTSTPGYFCEIRLEKPGASPIVLEKKQLTGEMGQSFASWNWESVSGKWSVVALLSNSSGQTKSSTAQTLEVR